MNNPSLLDQVLILMVSDEIMLYFCRGQADHPVNVDSKSYKITEENMGHPDRRDMRVMKNVVDLRGFQVDI